MTKKICFWTVADGNHGKMAAVTVASAKAVGVECDFHIWTDLPHIEGATVHPCGKFDKKLYMFKFDFLKNEVSKLDYDYFIFFDADNYFVSNPGNLEKIIGNEKVFIQMENDCTSPKVKRGDWWGIPIKYYPKFLREFGVTSKKIYNTNAGFWAVRKDAIDEFYKLAYEVFNEAHLRGYKDVTEEPPLACIGHLMQDPEKRTFEHTKDLWASDWTGYWKGKLPTKNIKWDFEDYMSGDKIKVSPSIVHIMRSKDKMLEEYEKLNKIDLKLTSNESKCIIKIDKEIIVDNGFWSGHQMLGDALGFCAAAHLLHHKTGKRIKVWFQESRKDALKYFDGVDWVPRNEIPDAIDCGRNPQKDEWVNMNGVKRFYKWMDPTLIPKKSFDIHMNCSKNEKSENLIGLITHANTQGDIPLEVLNDMISTAKKEYPSHKIVLFGNKDNHIIPDGVEDMRQDKGDINWIIEFMKRLDLLITPQTGPCFIAAGLNIPMWVYKSKEPHWDYVLNYDTYKVQKWWDKMNKISEKNEYEVFNNIYNKGGWDNVGSGSGSLVKNNSEYITLLHKIIDYTPNINSIVDIGCGDWKIMKELNIKKSYIGLDCSDVIINKNIKKYEKDNIKFKHSNAVLDELPDGDLCIIKDVLQHLPFSDINTILNKIKKFKYCVITNDYVEKNSNKDIITGNYRSLNILLDPFNVDGITLHGYNGKHVILITNKVNIL